MSQASENEDTATTHNTSGKRVTWFVLATLLLTVVSLSYVFGTYNQINQAREDSAAYWRTLVDELAPRHRSYELEIARGVDAEEIPMELGERFRLALDRFRTTSRQSTQLEAACEIESLIAETVEGLEKPESNLQQAISDFNSQQLAIRELVESPAGKLLSLVFVFSENTKFELAGS